MRCDSSSTYNLYHTNHDIDDETDVIILQATFQLAEDEMRVRLKAFAEQASAALHQTKSELVTQILKSLQGSFQSMDQQTLRRLHTGIEFGSKVLLLCYLLFLGCCSLFFCSASFISFLLLYFPPPSFCLSFSSSSNIKIGFGPS